MNKNYILFGHCKEKINKRKKLKKKNVCVFCLYFLLRERRNNSCGNRTYNTFTVTHCTTTASTILYPYTALINKILHKFKTNIISILKSTELRITRIHRYVLAAESRYYLYFNYPSIVGARARFVIRISKTIQDSHYSLRLDAFISLKTNLF